MKVIGLASVRGAPGVTTTALLLASTFTDGLVVEADLDGGVLAVRYGLGREPGLTTFAASGHDAEGGWRAHAQDAGGVPVLVGPDAPGASASLWRTAGERITHKLAAAADGVAVVDAGRLRSPVPLVAASDLLAVLVNPVADQLVALTHLVPTLRQAVRGRVVVVLVGAGPYGAAAVERSVGVSVVGELPNDPDAAEVLRVGGSRSRLARSQLARAVGALSVELGSSLLEPSAVGVAS